MVGLGGGFVMVPALRLLYGLSPAVAAGTSLILVVANSASGSFAYLRQKRVDVRLGLLIAAGGFPGSILGAIAVAKVSGFVFDILLGVFLTALATDIVVNNEKRLHGRDQAIHLATAGSMPLWRALLTGFFVGFVSSLFGIGGGVIVVPVLLYFSNLPAHAISATSHFAIVLTSPVGLLAHIQQRDINITYGVPLVLGGIVGGQIGAKLSLKLESPLLIKLVAAALVIAAVFLVLRHFI